MALLVSRARVRQYPGMFVKTKRVRRANRTYEYLSLVESVRVDGTNTHRTLFRLGEASALRESGELDRIIAALTAHAERSWVEVDELAAEQAPAIGTIATIKTWWDKLGLDGFFDRIGAESRWSSRLADAVFAMVAGRLCDPGSKRATHRWIADHVVAPDGFCSRRWSPTTGRWTCSPATRIRRAARLRRRV